MACFGFAERLAAAPASLASHAFAAEWRSLMHYRQHGSNWRSQADSPHFFLSATGATEPLDELEANRQAWREERDYSCRFPARAAFLATVFPASSPPLPDCPRYRQWRAQLQSDEITLVFASAYLNNPSSLFGHTMLRLDDAARRRHPLRSYTINFAAQTTQGQGVAFAWKGLTGGYPGRFGLYPYHEKADDYLHQENRDLWEYRLAFTAEEIDRLLAHLWELRDVAFDYYFLDENCSYQLLALLEAARPGLDLSSQFGLWAAPVDTIRALYAEPGLVRQRIFRPSLQSRLQAQSQDWTTDQRQALRELLWQGGDWPDSELWPEQAQLAELVHAWSQYQQVDGPLVSGRMANPQGLQALAAQALERRRQLPAGTAMREVSPPVPPDQGHAGQRWGLGLVWDADRDSADALLAWRPSLHDALDPAAGYAPGSEIAVLDTELSLGSQLRLHRLTVFAMQARTTRSVLFRPWSWNLGVGFERRFAEEPGLGYLQAGLGASRRLSGIAISGSLQSLIWEGGGERALVLGPRLSLQSAGRAGQWQLQFQRLWRMAESAGDLGPMQRREQQMRLSWQFPLSRDWAWRNEAELYAEDGALGLHSRLLRYF